MFHGLSNFIPFSWDLLFGIFLGNILFHWNIVAAETFCVLGGFWGNIWLGAIHLVAGWGGTGGGVRALHGKYWPSFNPPPTKHNLLLQRENFSLEVRLFELAPNLKIKSDIWWSSLFLTFYAKKCIKQQCPDLPENGSDFQKRSWWEASRVVSIPPARTKNNKRSLWFTTASPFAVIKWHLEVVVGVYLCRMLFVDSTQHYILIWCWQPQECVWLSVCRGE